MLRSLKASTAKRRKNGLKDQNPDITNELV
jgi:hypothetical protein